MLRFDTFWFASLMYVWDNTTPFAIPSYRSSHPVSPVLSDMPVDVCGEPHPTPTAVGGAPRDGSRLQAGGEGAPAGEQAGGLFLLTAASTRQPVNRRARAWFILPRRVQQY